jgi:DnaJ family protein C protein 28
MEHPTELLNRFTLEDIKRHRDSEWIAKEKNYHETAVGKLNALVRNYNGLAPYAVRRAYYTREAEVERLYDECAPAILRALAERMSEGAALSNREGSGGAVSGPVGGGQLGRLVNNFRFFEWLRLLFRRLFGIGT